MFSFRAPFRESSLSIWWALGFHGKLNRIKNWAETELLRWFTVTVNSIRSCPRFGCKWWLHTSRFGNRLIEPTYSSRGDSILCCDIRRNRKGENFGQKKRAKKKQSLIDKRQLCWRWVEENFLIVDKHD